MCTNCHIERHREHSGSRRGHVHVLLWDGLFQMVPNHAQIVISHDLLGFGTVQRLLRMAIKVNLH